MPNGRMVIRPFIFMNTAIAIIAIIAIIAVIAVIAVIAIIAASIAARVAAIVGSVFCSMQCCICHWFGTWHTQTSYLTIFSIF